MHTTIAYVSYLLITIAVIVVVGKILYHNGYFFLLNVFSVEDTAIAVNRFLYAGYCFMNIGVTFVRLNTSQKLVNTIQVLEFLANSIGLLLFILGIMHVLNLLLIPMLTKLFKKNINQ